MTRKQLDRLISKLIRQELDLSGTPYPIAEDDGFQEPKLEGRSYYWTTPSGKTEVHYPNAFARRGWPTVYHGSTLHITVGKGWICQALADHFAADVPMTGTIRFDSEGGFQRIP